MNKTEAVRLYHSGVGPTVACLLEQAETLENAQRTIDRLEKRLRGDGRFCAGCFEKQQVIEGQQEEIAQLKAKLRYREQRSKEGFFGSSTPSAQRPVKANSAEENRAQKGGGRRGHAGHGRAALDEGCADRVEDVSLEGPCPRCGGVLHEHGVHRRSVLELRPIRTEKIIYRLGEKHCPRCRKNFRPRAPAVLPKHLYGNQLLAEATHLHYVLGLPLGRVGACLGINGHHLMGDFHRLADRVAPLVARLEGLYRQAPVKHADETSWRTDGQSGYAWLFSTSQLSLYKVRLSRGATVAQEVFGQAPWPGVLVVDRYVVYRGLDGALQFCYAHLLRDVTDLTKQFPDDAEVVRFVEAFAPLLGKAMGLRRQPIPEALFYKRAQRLKAKIVALVESPAQHLGVRHIQDLFSTQAHRLYHWAAQRQVPADNNFCEQELRSLVIARKVSFGSQSERGARTREILMTVLHTLRKQTKDVVARLKAMFDQLATNPAQDPYPLLFPAFDSS